MRSLYRAVAISLVGLLACIEQTTSPPAGAGEGLTLIITGAGTVGLDSGHVIVSGPTSKTVTVAPGNSVTVGGLAPGSYTVTIQGFKGGGVGYFGQTTGVSVVAGQSTTATISNFASIQPTIIAMPTYTNGEPFNLIYSKVAVATGYVVQRDASPTFTTSQDTSISATDTNVTISIPTTGPYHVRVLALDPTGARGWPSAVANITTVTSITVTPATATILPGKTQAFTATAKDATGATVAGVKFAWFSLNQAAALVDTTGLATGIGGGTATIMALGLGIPGMANLTVTSVKVALLANGSYIDYQPGNLSSEGSNLERTLDSLGATVKVFTDLSAAGFSAATNGAKLLAIPEMELARMDTALTFSAKQTIKGFVSGGGTLLLFAAFEAQTDSLLNNVFTFTDTTLTTAAPYALDATAATGTPFAGGPASLPSNNATGGLKVTSLPVGSKAIYTSAGSSVLTVIPVGSGRIVVFGWDWFNAAPVGTLDGGFVEALRRATLF